MQRYSPLPEVDMTIPQATARTHPSVTRDVADAVRALPSSSAPGSGKASDEGHSWRFADPVRRAAPGYVHYLHLKGFEAVCNCGHTWQHEVEDGGDGERWKVIGCGDRLRCPRCADYYHRVQASDAVRVFEGVVAGAQARGVKVNHLLSVHWLTLPKPLSRELHRLNRGCDEDRKLWKRRVDALYRAARRDVMASLPEKGVQVGGVVVMHTNGSEDPIDPHYHFIVMLSPVAWVGDDEGVWVSLDRWWTLDGSLTPLRRRWTDSVRRVFCGVQGVEADGGEFLNVRREWREKVGQVVHTVRYELRAPLRDLWRGMKSSDRYERRGGRRGSVVRVFQDGELEQHFEDMAGVRSALRRVRWFGFLAPTMRGKRLPSLGFERRDDEDGEDTRERVNWIPAGNYCLQDVNPTTRVATMARDWTYIDAGGTPHVRREILEVQVADLGSGWKSPARVVSQRKRWVRDRDPP